MGKYMPRTDLVMEARELVREGTGGEVAGVNYKEDSISGIHYHIMEIFNDEGANALGKPKGRYCTIEIEPVLRRDTENFPKAATAAAELIRSFLPDAGKEYSALVVGLGNREITPDSVGPLAVEATLVTRHLKRYMPQDFAAFRDVSVVTPGVLGTSGIESADYIKCICDCLKPDCAIVVDALAARNMDRLCRTLQLTDTGIIPGSGVGNSRNLINSETLGIPVVAVGVPTVVDMRTVFSDYGITEKAGDNQEENDMIVTPRSIDSQVSCIGRLVGYSINMALHNGITLEDVDMMLG